MKKEYTSPQVEITEVSSQDIITMSTFDPLGLFDLTPDDTWDFTA